MEWLFEVEIQNANIFDELEIRTNYKYPDDFKSVALKFNGATPKCNTFDTKETEGRVFNYLISLNKNKEEMEEIIWDYFGDSASWVFDGLDWRYIPFADDPFGDLICFDRTNDHIVFWNHETNEVEEAADSFIEFVDSLYEDED